MQTTDKSTTAIKAFLAQTEFKGATLSCSFINLSESKNSWTYQSETLLAPASVTKVITTAAALLYLGGDYTYKTAIYYRGKIDNSELIGDIIVVGSGDPTLYSEYFLNNTQPDFFSKIVEKLNALGIKKLNGNIIIDATCFDDEYANNKWPYEDIGNYYGAGASGISYGDNKYEIMLKKINDSVVEVDKQLSGLDLTIHSEIKLKGSSDDAYVFSMPLNINSINIYGSIPSNKTTYSIFASHPNPPLYFGYTLLSFLKNNGISGIQKIMNEKASMTDSKLLYIHQSPKLSDIVYQTNQESDNHYAECLLKTMGLKMYGKGTTENGLNAMGTIFKKQQIDLNTIKMYDGSGLSPFNAISSGLIVQILKTMYADKKWSTDYFNSFPLAGKQGSLKSFGKGTALENNLRAKTGYIEKARAYAGTFKNKKGDTILFSTILNRYLSSPADARKLLEKICLEIYNR